MYQFFAKSYCRYNDTHKWTINSVRCLGCCTVLYTTEKWFDSMILNIVIKKLFKKKRFYFALIHRQEESCGSPSADRSIWEPKSQEPRPWRSRTVSIRVFAWVCVVRNDRFFNHNVLCFRLHAILFADYVDVWRFICFAIIIFKRFFFRSLARSFASSFFIAATEWEHSAHTETWNIIKITFGRQYLTRLFVLYHINKATRNTHTLYYSNRTHKSTIRRCRPREQWTFMFFCGVSTSAQLWQLLAVAST